jgi:hypothetical protein
LNDYSEEAQLADVFYLYGEFKESRQHGCGTVVKARQKGGTSEN